MQLAEQNRMLTEEMFQQARQACSRILTEVCEVKTDVAQLQSQVKTDVAQLQTQVKTHVTELQNQIQTLESKIVNQIQQVPINGAQGELDVTYRQFLSLCLLGPDTLAKMGTAPLYYFDYLGEPPYTFDKHVTIFPRSMFFLMLLFQKRFTESLNQGNPEF